MGKIPLTFGRMGSKHLPPLGIVLQTGFSSQLEEIPFAGLGWGPEVALSGTALVGSALLRGWGLAVPAPSLAGGARLRGFPRPTGGAGGSPTCGETGGEEAGAENSSGPTHTTAFCRKRALVGAGLFRTRGLVRSSLGARDERSNPFCRAATESGPSSSAAAVILQQSSPRTASAEHLTMQALN